MDHYLGRCPIAGRAVRPGIGLSLGIRAEDIQLLLPSSGNLTCQVLSYEYMGADTLRRLPDLPPARSQSRSKLPACSTLAKAAWSGCNGRGHATISFHASGKRCSRRGTTLYRQSQTICCSIIKTISFYLKGIPCLSSIRLSTLTLCPVTGCAAFSALAADAVKLQMYYPIAVGGKISHTVERLVADFEKLHPDISIQPVYTGTMPPR